MYLSPPTSLNPERQREAPLNPFAYSPMTSFIDQGEANVDGWLIARAVAESAMAEPASHLVRISRRGKPIESKCTASALVSRTVCPDSDATPRHLDADARAGIANARTSRLSSPGLSGRYDGRGPPYISRRMSNRRK